MLRLFFRARWLTLSFLFFSIAEVAVEYKVFGPSKPVTAEEKDAVLQCRVEPELDVTSLTVEWKLQDKLVHRYRSSDDDLVSQDPKFKGRTTLFRKEMVQGNIYLKVTNVTQEDAGNYTCIVSKLQGQVKKATVTLNVGGNIFICFVLPVFSVLYGNVQ
uniref:Ig-like domain-containing protein n=1 Tax=Poecilia formosa TaxID=48698 RepID=A0A096M4L2_POEFO